MTSFTSYGGLALLLLLATTTTICKSSESNAEAEDFDDEKELDEAPLTNQNKVGSVFLMVFFQILKLLQTPYRHGILLPQ